MTKTSESNETAASSATDIGSMASGWLQKSAAWLRSVGIPAELGTDAPEGERNTTERLKATLRRGAEALSPRELRRVLADLQGAAASEVSDVEGGRLAEQVMQWYASAAPAERQDLWRLLCEQLRERVQAIDCSEFAPGWSMTISGGVTERTGLSHHEKLVSRADARLYEAKRAGRNRICG